MSVQLVQNSSDHLVQELPNNAEVLIAGITAPSHEIQVISPQSTVVLHKQMSIALRG